MRQFSDVYRGRRVLLTGHTGFKGSWLSLWLNQLGATVSGVALEPETSPNHWDALKLDMEDCRQDIRDRNGLASALARAEPEIVFHLAAQALVRRSYRQPVETWAANLLGTVNLLDACVKTPSVRAVVIVTTDKCYANQGWHWGYREIDVLGGHDPYSASKAAVELATASFRSSYGDSDGIPLIASVRAGNVVGGGDWSEDRLIPDLVRAVASERSLEVRNPGATRPWQHVLEPLSGYLALGVKLLRERREFADAWNFGPGEDGSLTVADVLTQLKSVWPNASWHSTVQQQPHEAAVLRLDSSKAHAALGWKPVWSVSQGLRYTAQWYKRYLEDGSVLSRQQLSTYVEDAHRAGLAWAAA